MFFTSAANTNAITWIWPLKVKQVATSNRGGYLNSLEIFSHV